MRNDPNCKLCVLHKTAQNVCILGRGPEPCHIMVIGEAPGKSEDEGGKPFIGRSGELLVVEIEAPRVPSTASSASVSFWMPSESCWIADRRCQRERRN